MLSQRPCLTRIVNFDTKIIFDLLDFHMNESPSYDGVVAAVVVIDVDDGKVVVAFVVIIAVTG
jgi:hypothetical protein